MSNPFMLDCFRGKTLCTCLLLVTLASCYKEKPLTAAPPNMLYQLPQGNHPYDQEILQFYNTYNSYILYEFDSVDFHYNFTGPFMAIFSAVPADTNYVQTALNFLHANWLDVYPAAFLQKTLPLKILLASQLNAYNYYYDGSFYGHQIFMNALAGPNYIAFGLANSTLPNLSAIQYDSARGWLNQAYWQEMLQQNMIGTPPNFDSLTSYSKLNPYNLKQNGIINLYGAPGSSGCTPSEDFLDYIQLITSTSKTVLNNTWLSPAVDVNGMYNQKYNLITSYYLTNYGVDLQAIGNLP